MCLIIGSFKDIETITLVLIILAVLVLIITLCIGAIAINKFHKLTNMYKLLKYLFYVSVVAVIARCLCIIFGTMVCICVRIAQVTYYILLLSVLATLLVRLHHTFKNSVYAISTIKLSILFTLFIVTLIPCIGAIIVLNLSYFVSPKQAQYYRMLNGIFGAITIIFYMITGISTVISFSRNLLHLAEAQSNSPISCCNIKLNKSQKKLINQVSRYNALFTLAAITSFMVVITFSICAVISMLYDYDYIPLLQCITIVDCLVNIVCIFLQYSFATKYYIKYCHCLDKYWKQMVNKTILKSIKYQYTKSNLYATDTTNKIPVDHSGDESHSNSKIELNIEPTESSINYH
eukprot:370008_1